MTTVRINPAKITTCVIVVVTGNTLFPMHVAHFSEISVYTLFILYPLFSNLSTIIHILRSMRYVSQAMPNFTPSQNKFYLARQVKLLATADFRQVSGPQANLSESRLRAILRYWNREAHSHSAAIPATHLYGPSLLYSVKRPTFSAGKRRSRGRYRCYHYTRCSRR